MESENIQNPKNFLKNDKQNIENEINLSLKENKIESKNNFKKKFNRL